MPLIELPAQRDRQPAPARYPRILDLLRRIFLIFTAISVQLWADADLGGGATINEALNQGHNTGIDFFPDPSAYTPFIVMFLSGLPDEDVGDTKSTVGRLGQVLVFSVCALCGSYRERIKTFTGPLSRLVKHFKALQEYDWS